MGTTMSQITSFASKLRVTGLCAGNSLVIGEFPLQMATNAENAFIWWSHHGPKRIRDKIIVLSIKHLETHGRVSRHVLGTRSSLSMVLTKDSLNWTCSAQKYYLYNEQY